ncbi:hypothetical protein C7212DRAFT_348065 [Tuber magnatum]|uniref:Mid2 domain-containing protein n=1 Tax=Tuber magnatum TaxID=42249 RepID=A0A317SFY1_9PEZI|nr:hypothetical protein C7212DRAFT_348065 [Tuber magnatum]
MPAPRSAVSVRSAGPPVRHRRQQHGEEEDLSRSDKNPKPPGPSPNHFRLPTRYVRFRVLLLQRPNMQLLQHRDEVGMPVGDTDGYYHEYLSKHMDQYQHHHPDHHHDNVGYKSKTSSITLTRRGMPTPTRCVHRPEEEEGRWRELVRRADPTYFITIIVTVTATPPATYYLTTTRLSTYWITRYSTRTRTSFIGVARTSTITSTYKITTTTTYTTIKTTTVSQGGLSAGAKVGAGVGGGVGGLAVIVIVVALIWKKCTKPTAADVWAGNQPVEDGRGYAGLGKAPIGAGGMVLAAGATDKSYQGAYRAGYYGQNEDTVSAGTSSSPPPLQPPVAYFQPYQQSGHHLEGYQELEPNLIHTIPRRPVPGSPAPPSYQGSTQTGSGLQAWEEGRSEGVMRL